MPPIRQVRRKKVLQDITLENLDAYMTQHDLKLWFQGESLYYQVGTQVSRYMTAVGKNIIEVLVAIAKREKIPLMFKATNGKFAGTVGRVKTTGYNSVKLMNDKTAIQTMGLNEFLGCHTLSTESEELLVFDENDKPKDIFGSTFEINDILVIGKRACVVLSWDPISDTAMVNFGSSSRRVDLRGRETYINISRIDQPKILKQLMIKRLMKK